MRNQNFRAEVQQAKRSGANRLEWGAHNPNLKDHQYLALKSRASHDQYEWLAELGYDESSLEEKKAKR